MSLNLFINGEFRSVVDDADATLLDRVLTALSVRKELIAVALNDLIVPRNQWGKTVVSEGDRLEIVHFVGGGSSRVIEGKLEVYIGRSTLLIKRRKHISISRVTRPSAS
jgi:thiamine biosynthesis protein ThiS